MARVEKRNVFAKKRRRYEQRIYALKEKWRLIETILCSYGVGAAALAASVVLYMSAGRPNSCPA